MGTAYVDYQYRDSKYHDEKGDDMHKHVFYFYQDHDRHETKRAIFVKYISDLSYESPLPQWYEEMIQFFFFQICLQIQTNKWYQGTVLLKTQTGTLYLDISESHGISSYCPVRLLLKLMRIFITCLYRM